MLATTDAGWMTHGEAPHRFRPVHSRLPICMARHGGHPGGVGGLDPNQVVVAGGPKGGGSSRRPGGGSRVSQPIHLKMIATLIILHVGVKMVLLKKKFPLRG